MAAEGAATGATERIAAFAAGTTFDSLPPELVEMSRLLLIDCIGNALGAVDTDKGRIGAAVARSFGASSSATIIGGEAASPAAAAFANGELMSSLDSDPIMIPGHITPFVAPAVLAVAERDHLAGTELILGNVLAHELGARIASSTTAPVRQFEMVDGHLTEVLTPVTGYGASICGSAAAAGNLLGFDVEQIRNCIGVAGYMAPAPALTKWYLQKEAPLAKYNPAGWVAAGATTAALLVEKGYTGDADVLDGEHGLWRMFGAAEADWDILLRGLGAEWLVSTTEFKPYPSFRQSHIGLEAWSNLLRGEGITIEDIESVTVEIDPHAIPPRYLVADVRTHMQGSFSWPHLMGAAALFEPGPEWHSRAALEDPRIKALAEKIRFEPYPKLDNTGAEIAPGALKGWGSAEERAKGKDPGHVGLGYPPPTITVTAKGRTYKAVPPEYPIGHRKRPMELDAVAAKFIANAKATVGEAKAHALLERFVDLPSVPDVTPVLRELRRR